MRISIKLILMGYWLVFVIPCVDAWVAPGGAEITERIRRVETGILPLPAASNKQSTQPLAVAAQLSTRTVTIAERMRQYRIPGLSVAVIDEGRIEWAKGYGVAEQGGAAVTSATLFQAGSVSKSVMAVGVLRLVEQGRLALDSDVNQYLKSWHVPEDGFTKDQKVTIRRLLSHTAGLKADGYSGYARTAPLPTLQQILDGEAPANNPAIRVESTPGTRRSYSGGGYLILQQVVTDVTGKDFAEFMREEVLERAGMRSSTYRQPLPEPLHGRAASGHGEPSEIMKTLFPKGPKPTVEGGWRVYPEQAAAGLWTTPSDVARFVMALQDSLAGREHALLSQAMARQMITPIMNNYGLGMHAEGEGESLRFSHGGISEGFDTKMIGLVQQGSGAVMMINTNDNHGFLAEIQYAIGRAYGWPIPAPSAEVKLKK